MTPSLNIGKPKEENHLKVGKKMYLIPRFHNLETKSFIKIFKKGKNKREKLTITWNYFKCNAE